MMSIFAPGTPDNQTPQEGDMIAAVKNKTFAVLNNEYKLATVSTNDPIIEQYNQETLVCEQGTLWGAYKENGVIRNSTPPISALHNPETGKIISSEYHEMYKLGNAFVGVKVERNSQGSVIEGSETYFLVTPNGQEGKQFLGRVDVISGFNLAREFHKQGNNTVVNLFALDNLETPLEENVDHTLSFLNEKYGTYKINEPQDSINKKVFPKEKLYTVTNTPDRFTIIDKQGTVIYDIPRKDYSPACTMAYNANDTRVEINQGTQSIAIHIPSSRKIISDFGMNMHIKGKFLIDFINNYDCIVYDADGVKLPGFVQELQNNEHRMIALKNENKLQLLDTMTGEIIPQQFDSFLKKYTNDDGSITYVVVNNNTLIAIRVY